MHSQLKSPNKKKGFNLNIQGEDPILVGRIVGNRFRICEQIIKLADLSLHKGMDIS